MFKFSLLKYLPFLKTNKIILDPKFKIIGITGLKHNGKDTIANYLCQKYNYTKIAFADPLKEACQSIFGFNYEQIHGSLKETLDEYWFGLTPRQILQFVGTELFRKEMKRLNEEFGEELWILSAKKKITEIIKNNENALIVISDVRFPNECEMIKKQNGTLIRVVRSSVNISHDLHDSEKYVSDLEVDYEIINDGSIDDLNKKIDSIILSNID